MLRIKRILFCITFCWLFTNSIILGQYDLDQITSSLVKLRVLTEYGLEVDSAGLIKDEYEWGTGFYISSDGLILTAYHVVGNADKSNNNTIRCYEPFSNDSKSVRLVYYDEKTDLAILQNEKYTSERKLKNYINILGKGSILKMGMNCYCLGFPLEIINTKNSFVLSPGKLIAIDKDVKGSDKIFWRKKLLVADCEINIGFSGGLVFDDDLNPIGLILGMYQKGNKKVLSLVKRLKDIRVFLKESRIEFN